MIARIWHGKTALHHYEAYSKFMIERAIPDYQKTSGYIDHRFLRKQDATEAHFTLITFWDNLDVIKNFAGENYTEAKYYPEDKDYLLEFEKFVEHFEVFA